MRELVVTSERVGGHEWVSWWSRVGELVVTSERLVVTSERFGGHE